jgi:hypothetical protein
MSPKKSATNTNGIQGLIPSPRNMLLKGFLILPTSELEFLNILWVLGTKKNRLSYRFARLQAGGIDALESVPGLLKSLQIRALYSLYSNLCPDLVRLAGGGFDVVELPVRDVGLPEDEGQVEQQADQARGRTHPPDTTVMDSSTYRL